MAPRKTNSKKTAAAPAPVVEAAPAPPAAENVVEAAAPTFADDLAEVMNLVSGLRSTITVINSKLRGLKQRHDREVKAAAKTSRKKRSTNRQPSGFTKPAPISDAMAKFLGREKGTQMARTEVTKEIRQYVMQHDLHNKDNRRIINCDAKLRKLLSVGAKEELTYFNLQRYLKPHFPPAQTATA